MLTQAQRETLRTIMGRRAAELESLIDEERELQHAERYPQNKGEVGDAGDEAVGDDMASTEGRLIDLHRAELGEIRAAAERFAAGTYGSCADCGDPIGFDRLQVNPAVRRCGPCQQRHEIAAGARRIAR